MFGKKILSIVGLLFLGSHISRVSASNCIISSTDGDTDCSVTTSDDCTNGFVIAKSSSTSNYAYNKETSATGDNKILIEIKGEHDACEVKTIPGYYTSGGSYFSVNYNGVADDVTPTGSCESGNEGKLISDNLLCLDGTITQGFGALTDKYITGDKGTIFSNTNTNSAAVTFATNSITLDTSFDGSDYCVDDNKVIFDDRKKALCDTNASFTEEDCSGYYNCEKGVCTVSNTNVDPRNTCIPVAGNSNHCAEGYYLTVENGSDLATSSATTHHLWLCSNGSTCTDLTDDGTAPIGYLKNSGNPDDFEYINCTKSKCDILKFGDDETCAETADASSNQVATGTLYTNSGNVRLCVYNGGDKSLTLSGTPDQGNFFVSIGSSLFGLTAKSDNFIVVKVDDKGNLTVVKESSAVRYRYILTGDDKREIHSRSTAKTENSTGEICGTGGSPTEFIMNQWDSSPNIDNDKADYYVQEA